MTGLGVMSEILLCNCHVHCRPSKGKKLKEAISPRRLRLHRSPQKEPPVSKNIEDTGETETLDPSSTMTKTTFTEKEQIDLRETFDTFDSNGDGKISCSELATVIRVLRFDICDKDIQEMIKIVDSNENGVVDYDEYLSLMQRFSSQKTPDDKPGTSQKSEEKTLEAFRVFDLDGNGYIDRNELRTVMRRLGENINEEDVREMFREADLNNDGRIDLSEFSQILLHMK